MKSFPSGIYLRNIFNEIQRKYIILSEGEGAQVVECQTPNQEVLGLNPAWVPYCVLEQDKMSFTP